MVEVTAGFRHHDSEVIGLSTQAESASAEDIPVY